MPNYSFKNKSTNEEFVLFMKISEREKYLEDNPHIEQILTISQIVDPVGIGIVKPPSEFQTMVLGRVKERTPGATEVGNRRWVLPREW